MARSEYWSCPFRLPTPAAAHVVIASGVSQSVTSPRCTRALSYSGQFPTRYLVLYFGWTLDFTSRSCPGGRHDGQNTDGRSPSGRFPRTNAAVTGADVVVLVAWLAIALFFWALAQG